MKSCKLSVEMRRVISAEEGDLYKATKLLSGVAEGRKNSDPDF